MWWVEWGGVGWGAVRQAVGCVLRNCKFLNSVSWIGSITELHKSASFFNFS